jgi:hypothetical protein
MHIAEPVREYVVAGEFGELARSSLRQEIKYTAIEHVSADSPKALWSGFKMHRQLTLNEDTTYLSAHGLAAF